MLDYLGNRRAVAPHHLGHDFSEQEVELLDCPVSELGEVGDAGTELVESLGTAQPLASLRLDLIASGALAVCLTHDAAGRLSTYASRSTLRTKRTNHCHPVVQQSRMIEAHGHDAEVH